MVQTRREGWALDRGRIMWRRVCGDGALECGVTSGKREGMARAVEGLGRRVGGRGGAELEMGLAHRGGVRRHLPYLSRGWGGGKLRVSAVVHRELARHGGPVRFGWRWGYEVTDIHLRYAAVVGGGGARWLWLGTASLVAHEGVPEWWVVVPVGVGAVLGRGGWGTEVGVGGVWLGRHRNRNLREVVESAGLGRLESWSTYYAHPTLVRWAHGQGCRVLVNRGQRSLNRPMVERMAGMGVRQWNGHGKVVVGERGVMLTTMNGSRYGPSDRGGEEELSLVIRGSGAERFRGGMRAVWSVCRPIEAAEPNKRERAESARVLARRLALVRG